MATNLSIDPELIERALERSGELSIAGRDWKFQHVDIGNPQCSMQVATEKELELLDLPAIGPAFEHHHLFPNRTNVSWYTVLARLAGLEWISKTPRVIPKSPRQTEVRPEGPLP